jgi:hypothetical protein
MQTALIILLTFGALAAHANPLFPDPTSAAAQEPVRFTLTLPIRDVMRSDDGSEWPAQLALEGAEPVEVKVRRRGKSRLEHCQFKPLWLNFQTKDLRGTVFAGQNRVKLVTHCTNGFFKRGYLATELLSYRLLNNLTDASFRVRAAAITYIDADNQKAQAQHGFIIEHKKDLAKRLDATDADVEQMNVADYRAANLALLALFQYAIGNTDFSFIRGPADDDCCHNSVVLRSNSSGDYLNVPYDFDNTGLVNPPYAVPGEGLKIRSVTQRLYRGYCSHNGATQQARELILERKDDLLGLFAQGAEIPNLRIDKTRRYLDKFFAVLESDKDFEQKVLGRCRP